ncbi:MAG: nitroreductase [Deltaproteobacteria bacterium]|nr:nitroreductase [Deltaproteobacteria bacterium]
MELQDAVRERHTIRAFLPDPIPRGPIEKIVDVARWAPSWGNTQPWEIVAADGEKVRELGRALGEATAEGRAPNPDLPIPDEWPEPHKARYVQLGRGLLTKLGIRREDGEARRRHYVQMARFFGAPTALYLCIDARLNAPYACLDLGSIGTTICYLAREEGLGSTYLAASMLYPDLVRAILGIPADKKIVIGIALGLPDPEAPGSLFRAERAARNEILRFA